MLGNCVVDNSYLLTSYLLWSRTIWIWIKDAELEISSSGEIWFYSFEWAQREMHQVETLNTLLAPTTFRLNWALVVDPLVERSLLDTKGPRFEASRRIFFKSYVNCIVKTKYKL